MRPPYRTATQPAPEISQAADGGPVSQRCDKRSGVLVVDDDHLVRIMVQLGLEREGFEVWLASDGREAIQLYRRHREHVSAVLLDPCMPGWDAPATVDALRKLNPEVLVCFMSGNADNDELEELRQRGAAHVITKSFLLNELANVLRHLMRGMAAEPLLAGARCQE